MSYIKKIFSKSIDELSVSDIKTYFETPQEETSIIEFKSGDVEINDIFKEITAFLNTEGGLLIIGAPRETKEMVGKNEKVICTGDLTFSKFRNKDWLYQKIASNIVPTPVGLKIFQHLDSNGAIFIIDVPQSQTPPHQCSSDGRYYLRLEREAKPAPHGIIQALFQKRRIPKLVATIEIKQLSSTTDNVLIRIRNDSTIPADKVSFIIDVYNINSVKSEYSFKGMDDDIGYKFTFSNSAQQVLVRIVSIPIEFIVEHKDDDYVVFVGYWSIDTDFDFQFWSYNPIKKEIVCTDRMDYEKTSFEEEIQRILKK